MQAVTSSTSNASSVPIDRSVWHILMVSCAIIIAFDPIKVFELPLFQQIPVALVVLYFVFGFLRRPLAPLHSLLAVLISLLFFYALPGIIYNKMTQETGLFTAIMLFLLPISASYAIDATTDVNVDRLLSHAQWIGIAFYCGSLIRLASDPNHELLYYGIHERSFLLAFILVPAILKRSVVVFCVSFIGVALLISLDFRATTAFCFFNSIILPLLLVRRVSILVIIGYIAILILCLLSAYVGYDLIWELYAIVKGAYSNSINDEVRRAAIALAFDEWAKSPIWGDFFSGAGAYDIAPYVKWWQEGLIPLHNDYLDFLIRGGVIGLLMFLAVLGCAMMTCINNIKSLSWRNDLDLHHWNIFLFVNVTNIIFVISFNAILKTVSDAFCVQLVFAWIVALQLMIKNRRHLRHNDGALTNMRAPLV